MTTLRRKKNIVFAFILILLVYGLIEMSSFLGLAFLSRYKGIRYDPVDRLSEGQQEKIQRLLKGELEYLSFNPALGWDIKPNSEKDIYRSNSQGIRSSREYSPGPDENVIYVAAFGDSYTHGDEVANDQTWLAYLEGFHDELAVMNFGVPGYGLDQAYLRYVHFGRSFYSDIVLIGFMTENISRHVNRFRPSYSPNTEIPLTKPRFALKDAQLVLLENPIQDREEYRRLLENDKKIFYEILEDDFYFASRYFSHLMDFLPSVRLLKILKAAAADFIRDNAVFLRGTHVYNPESEAFLVTTLLMDRFYHEVAESGARPIVVIFPARYHIRDYLKCGKKSYAPLLEYLEARNMRYIDLLEEVFKEKNEEQLKEFFLEFHFSPRGNEAVAKAISRHLNDMLKPPPEVISTVEDLDRSIE